MRHTHTYKHTHTYTHMANNAHVHEIEGVEPLGFTGEAGEQRGKSWKRQEETYISRYARARTHARTYTRAAYRAYILAHRLA